MTAAGLEPHAVLVMVDVEDDQVAVGVRDALHTDATVVALGLVVELVDEGEPCFGRAPIESERGGSLEELSVGIDFREAEVGSTHVHEREVDLLLGADDLHGDVLSPLVGFVATTLEGSEVGIGSLVPTEHDRSPEREGMLLDDHQTTVLEEAGELGLDSGHVPKHLHDGETTPGLARAELEQELNHLICERHDVLLL